MTGQKPLILVIEDDRPIRTFLRMCLSLQDYRVVEAENATTGVSMASSYVPDLVILDLGLPDRDGIEVLDAVRRWSRVPVIILSARDQERDKVAALDAGADDYLTKPFGVDELLARVRVSLRHASVQSTDVETLLYRHGALTIDLEKRRVTLGNDDVHLTPIEYRLLAVLARNAGRVVTHNQLLRDVWGPESEQQNDYLRVFMASLRRKVEEEPSRPHYLVTEVGVGYRLIESDDMY
ncbi:MAG TPA: response regulator [Spirochaetia bacterium]|nr:response regulator [Spirochaetia bacterium]